MRKSEKLEEAFGFVRKTFFPRWDRNGRWSVRIVRRLPGYGRCETATKTICLGDVADDDDSLHCILIHEICHTAKGAGGYHGKEWLNRMRKAGETAERIGRLALSKMLHEQVTQYSDPDKSELVAAEAVYGKIEDYVFENPVASYDNMLNVVAPYCGLYPEELEKQFRRCRRVYEGSLEKVRAFKNNRSD